MGSGEHGLHGLPSPRLDLKVFICDEPSRSVSAGARHSAPQGCFCSGNHLRVLSHCSQWTCLCFVCVCSAWEGGLFNFRGENGPLNQEQHQDLLRARCPLRQSKAMQSCSLSAPHLLINHICAPAMQTCPRPDYLLLNKCISVNQEACFNYLIEELLIHALILNVRMFQKEKQYLYML